MKVKDAARDPCAWSSSTCHLESKSWRDLRAWGCPGSLGTASLCPGAPERGALSRCSAFQATRPRSLRHVTRPGRTRFTRPCPLAISCVGRGTCCPLGPSARRPPPPTRRLVCAWISEAAGSRGRPSFVRSATRGQQLQRVPGRPQVRGWVLPPPTATSPDFLLRHPPPHLGGAVHTAGA